MDFSFLGASVHEILWARILEWVAIPFSRGSSLPKDRTWVSHSAVTQLGKAAVISHCESFEDSTSLGDKTR